MLYDKFARNYDKALAPFENRFLSGWREETVSHLPENARLLEIGAGTGANFRFYSECNEATASEISFKMLEIARTKNRSVKLVQADAQNMPFVESYFDAAFATLVFCSIPNPQKAFAELKRVVKKGGKIVLLEHVRPNNLLGYAFDTLNVLTIPLFEDCFNRRTAEIAENSGLKIIQTKEKAFGIVNLIVCKVVK